MRRAIGAVILALGLGAAVLVAADFWETKKFTEWTDKDVQKMLKDSPWARTVEVPLSVGGGGGGGGGRGRRGGGGGIPGAASGGMGGGGEEGMGGGGGMPRGGDMGGMEARPTMNVILRWHSSLPVKQAVARARFGDEVGTSPDAAQMLSRQEERYIVGIAGLPMMAVRAKPEELKSRTELRIKGKQPIVADHVQADRQEKTVNLYFFFPREVNGQPAIKLEDKDVEVVCKLPNMEIKRKFRLKDMVFDGKLEL